MPDVPAPFRSFDQTATRWLADHAVLLLRLSLGIVFLWFGVLKFIPGSSPAEGLAIKTISILSGGLLPETWIPFGLATWECLIGIGLLSGVWMRATLLLLLAQMCGTFTPLVLFSGECFTAPFVPTLEGQYIIKNLVLVAAGLAIGATVRGGKIHPEPRSQ